MLISKVSGSFDACVELPGSKSESNRALMISHYAGFKPSINNLSTASDTELLSHLLQEITSCQNKTSCKSCLNIISCQNAGTVFRFLVTSLSMTPGTWLLTGSERMLKRPVGHLVKALRNLGACIDYQTTTGFPPLLITGKHLKGGDVFVDVSKSSQYASSLLLAAPKFKNGLRLHLDGKLTSLPYIDMTIEIMSKYGAKVHRDERDVYVEHSEYQNVEYDVEGDWSGASYWYEAVALSDGGKLRLKNLGLSTVQGDRVVADIFKRLGVTTNTVEDGVMIEKSGIPVSDVFEFDFIDTPDLFPAVAATCAALGVEATLSGLINLSIKESNRVDAMVVELGKLGVQFDKVSDDVLKIMKTNELMHYCEESPIVFDSHDDHRIAMSLAPLSMKVGAVEIRNAETVSKSYPTFWEDFSQFLN